MKAGLFDFRLLLLCVIVLALSSACTHKSPPTDKEVIRFSLRNADTSMKFSIIHLESQLPDFTYFDTLKSFATTPVFDNDSQWTISAYHLLSYHKLIFVADTTVFESNVFPLLTDSAHFNVLLSDKNLIVSNADPIQSRYKYSNEVLISAIIALLAELIILIILFAGIRFPAVYSFHSLWMNLICIPFLIYIILKFNYLNFPLSLAALMIIILLKAVFMYYATKTVRPFSRFFILALLSNGIAYALAWICYYMLILL